MALAISKKSALIAWIVLGALIIVDRAALYAWQMQVIRFYKTLRTAADGGDANPPKTPYGYVSIGLEPLLVMPKRKDDAGVRYVTLRTDTMLVQPSTVTLDGAGGLHLRFLPPRLAWTTWLIPRHDSEHHADPVSLDPRLHYQYRLDVEPGDSGVSVFLHRGPQHFSDPLRWDELKPQWLP